MGESALEIAEKFVLYNDLGCPTEVPLRRRNFGKPRRKAKPTKVTLDSATHVNRY